MGTTNDTTPYQTGMLDTSVILLRGGDDSADLAARSPAGFLSQERHRWKASPGRRR